MKKQKESKLLTPSERQRAYRKELGELPLGRLELMYNTTHGDHPEFCAEYIRRLRFEVINQRSGISEVQVKLRNHLLDAKKIKCKLMARIDRLKQVNHLLTVDSFEKVR